MRRGLIALLCLLWASTAWASYNCSNPAACTVTCDGASDHTDLASAIAAATAGSTVTVGAGTCDIGSTVTISKALTLAGAGKALTIFDGSASPMVTLSQGASAFARVTGIGFSGDPARLGDSEYTAIRLNGAMAQVRVDHNACTQFYVCVHNYYYGVQSAPFQEGVVDHNDFTNCERCIYAEGPDTPIWTYQYNAATGNFYAGTSHAMFYEDNTFVRTDPNRWQEIHYMQMSHRSVFRYNTVTYQTGSDDYNFPWESHGNQTYYDSVIHPAQDTFRGQPITEVYNNTFYVRGSPRIWAPRSGSNLIFNNEIYVSNPVDVSNLVRLVEEEAWINTSHFAGIEDYVWPNEDMITNTFIWNNYYTPAGGSRTLLTTANVWGTQFNECCGNYPNATYVINYNRDVWMHAPEASGGRTYYNDRPGASGRDADGTLVFTQSGANAYYPYTPYTYPHPLVGASLPNAPTNVRIR